MPVCGEVGADLGRRRRRSRRGRRRRSPARPAPLRRRGRSGRPRGRSARRRRATAAVSAGEGVDDRRRAGDLELVEPVAEPADRVQVVAAVRPPSRSKTITAGTSSVCRRRFRRRRPLERLQRPGRFGVRRAGSCVWPAAVTSPIWERPSKPPSPSTSQTAIVSQRPRGPVTAAASPEITAAADGQGASPAKATGRA